MTTLTAVPPGTESPIAVNRQKPRKRPSGAARSSRTSWRSS
ncbi:hypothetical protein Q0F99_06920 [Rathayibacter oskolensis]|nr:hypothetical protein [Rathayibacter oskolensis]WKK72657.1 hypothetical protein Q0F99_06920 [Rathayibacter oskolensis]